MSTDAAADGLQLNDPQTLYRRWEDSQWSPFAIDLARDGEQWGSMDGPQRELISFVLSSLMVAEERITTRFTGLVAAHGSEEEATFLATQQVDEARHMQFYARFQDEVVAEPEVIAGHVDRARKHVSDAFRHLFDEALVRAHEELVAAPGDLAAKVRFVTLYHLILEGALGLTSFKFVTDYLREHDLLGGARPETAEVVRQTLRDLLPSVADTLKPPGGGSEDLLGVTQEEIRAFALGGLTRRLKIIGVPLETVFA